MAHQRPKGAEEDSYSYTLRHEISALIQELTNAEKAELDLSTLSTSNYLTRLIKREAASKLDDEARARAQAKHEEKTSRRISEGADDPANPPAPRKRGRKAPAAEALVS